MSSPPSMLLAQYRYDALDRLADCTPTDLPIQQRFYQRNRLASEIHGQVQHSYFQQPDILLAQQQHVGTNVDTTLLACDEQRSVLQALNRSQRQTMAYTPYGHRAVPSGLLSLLGFNGEREDPITGHYLLGNGYRAFNPSMMRFNSPDSMSPFAGGGLNAYAYCAGDPVNGTDPTGHFPLAKLGALAAIVGVGWMAASFATEDETAVIAMYAVGSALVLGGLAGIGARAYRASGGRLAEGLPSRGNSVGAPSPAVSPAATRRSSTGSVHVGEGRGPTLAPGLRSTSREIFNQRVVYRPGESSLGGGLVEIHVAPNSAVPSMGRTPPIGGRWRTITESQSRNFSLQPAVSRPLRFVESVPVRRPVQPPRSVRIDAPFRYQKRSPISDIRTPYTP